MKYKSEEEFGDKVIEILRLLGMQTWHEVSLGKDLSTIDIIARGKDSHFYMACELKLVLNDTVLIQAAKNLRYVDYSCVIVPPHTRKRWRASEVKKFYAKEKGLGILMISPNLAYNEIKEHEYTSDDLVMSSFNLGGLEAILPPKLSKEKISHKNYDIENYISDLHKENKAGVDTSHNNLTPFQYSCILIKEYLTLYPNSTKKQVWDAIHDRLHWASYSSMYNSFRQLGHTKHMRDIKFKK